MLRVRLSAEDLGRIRIGRGQGPLGETIFGLDALQRGGSEIVFGAWRRRVAAELGAWARPLLELWPRSCHFDLNTIAGPAASLDEGLDAFRSAPRPSVAAELEYSATTYGGLPPWTTGLLDRDGDTRAGLAQALGTFHRYAVAPHWPRVQSLLETEHQRLARMMATNGAAGLLASLHPAIRWRPPFLEFVNPGAVDRLQDAQGRGVTIVPSVFGPLGCPLATDLLDPSRPLELIYPVIRDPGDAKLVWDPGGTSHEAMAALLGRTRATVLQVIAEGPCTTTELARRVGCSLATVSEHASVLRAAGLVTTRRRGSSVLHSLTPRGAALLG